MNQLITVLSVLLALLIAVVAIPSLVLLVQAICAFPKWRARPLPAVTRARTAILIPAHNEGMGVVATIASILPQLKSGDRVLVVADNCSDNTADCARQAGAEVAERFNDELRGKGYALDFGVRQLEANAPDIVIIVDADCIVTPGAIERLVTDAQQSGRPVQAQYLMKAPEGSKPMKKIAEFAWLVKNLVRPLGFHRLGQPCHLMGSGMAFPWKAISTAALATGHIVEDMKLGIDLARASTPTLYCPDALVLSTFPVSAEGTKSQRTRWEHGHLSMIIDEAPALFRDGLTGKGSGTLALALDLSVPPVALLGLVTVAMTAVAALFGLLTQAWLPALLAAVACAAFGLAIMLSWWRYGRRILAASELMMAVFYMFWKIPVYLAFMVRRQVSWVRSKRDSE